MRIENLRKYRDLSSAPIKEEPKKVILPKVEVAEEKIEDPDDGEGEG